MERRYVFIIILIKFYGICAEDTDALRNINIPTCSFVRKTIDEASGHFEISGEWASKRCEVRPGPEFVLRLYSFSYDGRYVLHHHFYKDGNCSVPLYTITSHGKLKLQSIRNSIPIPGAKEIKQNLRKVKVHAHSSKVRRRYERLLQTKCPSCLDSYQAGKSREVFPVYFSTNDCNCLESIKFFLNELEILRTVETTELNRYNKSQTVRETLLFAGNVREKHHSNDRNYRSNFFQDPMVKDTNAYQPNCYVCNEVLRASNSNPPRLLRPPSIGLRLDGSWVSVRCEVRPETFVIRHLRFNSSASTWQGQFSFFRDSDCSKPMYTLKALGSYIIERASESIPETYEAIFDTLQLHIVPHTKSVTSDLNSEQEKSKLRFVTNEESNVTATGGLSRIGIHLPNREYEIIKTTREENYQLLFTGRRPNEGGNPDERQKRATSFQDELKRCEEGKEDKGFHEASSSGRLFKTTTPEFSDYKKRANTTTDVDKKQLFRVMVLHRTRGESGAQFLSFTYSLFLISVALLGFFVF